MDVDPSVRKIDRGCCDAMETCPEGEPDKPGFWDATVGTYKLHAIHHGMVSGDRSLDPTDEAAMPKHLLPRRPVAIPAAFQPKQIWKPMSAAKLREAAKHDNMAKNNARRRSAAADSISGNAELWKATFDDEQPLSIDEAADNYASWTNSGRQGEDAKETTFVACKDYKYRVRGPGRCKVGLGPQDWYSRLWLLQGRRVRAEDPAAPQTALAYAGGGASCRLLG